MKTALIWIGCAAGVLAVILGLYYVIVYVFGGAQRDTADYRGGTSVIEKTRADGDYRLAKYNYFKNTCADIQSTEDQLAAMAADKSLPKTMRATNVLALTNKRNTLINEYNAEASNENAADFRDDDLPAEIDKTKEHTEC